MKAGERLHHRGAHFGFSSSLCGSILLIAAWTASSRSTAAASAFLVASSPALSPPSSATGVSVAPSFTYPIARDHHHHYRHRIMATTRDAAAAASDANDSASSLSTSLTTSMSWDELNAAAARTDVGQALNREVELRKQGRGGPHVQSTMRLFDSKEDKPNIILYRDHAGWCVIGTVGTRRLRVVSFSPTFKRITWLIVTFFFLSFLPFFVPTQPPGVRTGTLSVGVQAIGVLS
jgi:hypothetical protein